MKRLRFYKETNGRWYVDLPEWTGEKDALEMVAGADTMLEYMAEGNNEVTLNISESYFENSDLVKFVMSAFDTGEGAYYRIEKYKGIEICLEMWLCPVLEWVFGKYPANIFVASTN